MEARLRLSAGVSGRKLRLEFPGACYHVINRGNNQRDIFRSARAKAAFERCLFAACERSDWVLHAFVIMRNHFHLAVETPAGNLIAGMHWLQGTFANRFNRFRGESGYLFQGRYKALLVEDGDYLETVCHYIHLNPVRARALPVQRLDDYRYSSFWYLRRPTMRPPWLRLHTVLASAGSLADTSAGWESYQAYLAWQMADGPLAKSSAYARMSRGWALGGKDFKAALIRDHALAASARAWENQGAAEIRAQAWEQHVVAALRLLQHTETELLSAKASAPWKVALATFLRERSHASNGWLAKRLHMKRAKYVSRLVTARPQRPDVTQFLLHLRGKWAT